MTSNNKAERLYFIDNIRGIAALLVLFSHTFEYFIESWPRTYFEHFNLGMIGVSSFFIVSGFVMPLSLEKYDSIKIFVINRLSRIYPLYIFVFLATLLLIKLGIVYNWANLSTNIFKTIFVNLFILQDYVPSKWQIINLVGSSWTLFLEFFWYGVFCILYLSKINKKHLLLIICSSIFLVSLSLLSILLNVRIPLGHLVLIQCCFIGLLFYRHFTKQISQKTLFTGLIISFFGILIALFVSFYIFSNPMFSFKCILVSYSIGVILFSFFFLYQISNKILSFLGKISYSIYLSHGLILYIFKYIFNDYGFLYVVLSIFSTILFSFILFNMIEQPFLKYFKLSK